jgi:hypothetical protein
VFHWSHKPLHCKHSSFQQTNHKSSRQGEGDLDWMEFLSFRGLSHQQHLETDCQDNLIIKRQGLKD